MSETLSQLDYLVITCHPDDAEICCGGAVLSLKANGARVGILDLTDGEPTPHVTLEIRQRETAAATAIDVLNEEFAGLAQQRLRG